MRIVLPEPKQFILMLEYLLNIKIDKNINGITTDSRLVEENDLFITIDGKFTRGIFFLEEASSKGASLAITNTLSDNIKLHQIKIKDTILFLGAIAKEWRLKFKIPIIAITGTNGKTSTRELLSHVLSEKYNVHSTKENYNTSIGLPLTLLTLNSSHTISIIEMGADSTGDIDYLSKISIPTHGLITNISPAHLTGFESLESIINTKSELFNNLHNGVSFLNFSDSSIKNLRFSGKKISFGISTECDYPADIIKDNDNTISLIINSLEIKTGSQNLSFAKNLIAVTAIALHLGFKLTELQLKILSFKSPQGRCTVKNYDSITVIDDSYNANIVSTKSAINFLDTFADFGRKILIFGDMLELGDKSKIYHEEVALECSNSNIDAVYTVGTDSDFSLYKISKTKHIKHFQNNKNLIKQLRKDLISNDIVLFKGSRGMRLENVIKGVFK